MTKSNVINEKNYYDLLEIEKYSKVEDIKKAYKKMVLKYHPDVNKDIDSNEKYKNMVKAYTVLKDAELKEQYDIQLKKDQKVNIPKFKFDFLNTNFLIKPDEIVLKIKIFFKNISFYPKKEKSKIINDKFNEIFDNNYTISDDILSMPLEELEQRLLHSDNRFVKLNAATAIGLKKEIKSYITLEKMLSAADVELKKRIIWAIGNLNMKKSLNMLKLIYNMSNAEIKIEILKAVFKITEGKGSLLYTMLINGLNNVNEDLQAKALELMSLTNKKINYTEFKNIFNNSSKKIKIIIDKLIAENRIVN